MANKFIVFEGIDGSGKTTQSKLLAEKINGKYTCEPTNGDIGKLIRDILSGKKCEKETLALLFAADRVEHVVDIEQHLKKTHIVCDRYVYSSMVYQAIQGIDLNFIMNINQFAKKPDILIFLDVDVEESFKRMNGKNKEIFENKEMLNKVRAKYYEIIKKRLFEPKYGYIKINTTGKSIEEVHDNILTELREKNIF
ncbi:dTMP kinase [Methanothermococcus okinawensis]|uniref:Probable thymidylate kinase n=1 Tax=Methanothermococcus okinawensis (strain DSM 14208 / JCM 11175 / IH1) TaxID=647113 RepID=F8AMZ7_METOI|nr:dTMP kinase [Methanothermococcus okinawensis]AEH06120.1 Thymidylate kinase [Methanothermococcus okinawensis IH1]